MELHFHHMFVDMLAYVSIVLLVIYLYFMSGYNYWKDRNFPFLKPIFPFGNCKSILCKFPGPTMESADHYKEIKKKGYKFAGVFSIIRPILVVIDPEMVKDILVKDFDYFGDRAFYHTKSDPLSVTLFSMDAVEWKEMRVKLTPTFTSGKIKMMIPTIVSLSERMTERIDDLMRKNAAIDIKEIATTFTINTLAICNLGIETAGLENDILTEMTKKHFQPKSYMDFLRFSLIDRFPDTSHRVELIAASRIFNCALQVFGPDVPSSIPIDFVEGDMATDSSLYQHNLTIQNTLADAASLSTSSIFTAVLDGLNLLRKEVSEFFIGILKDAVRYRRQSKVSRSDFLEVLMKMKDESKNASQPFTDENLAAQVFLFFLASLDTSSSSILFALYELATHPSMQEKVRKEITDILREHNGDINSDSLHEMKYLRQVIDETLRLYPPLPTLDRKCIRNYRIKGTDLVIEKGTCISIPIYGLHRDPDNYSDPEEFDPERFSEENKDKTKVYLPFGAGPRNCIGLRFGIMLIQVALIEILRNFKMSVSAETHLPFEMDKQCLMLTLKRPILFNAERIQE